MKGVGKATVLFSTSITVKGDLDCVGLEVCLVVSKFHLGLRLVGELSRLWIRF